MQAPSTTTSIARIGYCCPQVKMRASTATTRYSAIQGSSLDVSTGVEAGSSVPRHAGQGGCCWKQYSCV